MSLRANLVMALRGISSNWLRSLLTMLGVLIGVAAVIVLLAVGTGSSRAVESRIDQLGTNTLTVSSSGRFGRGTAQTGTQSRNATLTLADVKLISDPDNAPDVQSVSPVVSTSETATYDGATYSTSVIGSTPSYMTATNYTVSAGRAITATDVTRHAQVVDIGADVASNLFAVGSNPIGQEIQLGSAQFQVVGLLAAKGTSGLTNQDAVVIAPYTAVQDQLTGESQSFSELLVQGKSSSTLTLGSERGREHPGRTERHHRGQPALQGSERSQPTEHGHVHHQHLHRPARLGGGGVASRGSHRSDEHHVGHGDGAHA